MSNPNEPAAVSAIDVVEHRSRWGYHTTSYDVFLKLKQLYKLELHLRKQAANFNRWARKHPSNRVRRHYLRNEAGQRIGIDRSFAEAMRRPEVTRCQYVLHVRASGQPEQQSERVAVSLNLTQRYRHAKKVHDTPPPRVWDKYEVARLEAQHASVLPVLKSLGIVVD